MNKKNRNQRGMALITALAILVFVVPIAMVFLKLASDYMINSTKERQLKTARSLADNVIVDVMREFSQSYYINRYASDYTTRAESFYKMGFSTVTVIADPNAHYMYMRALGKYGQDPNKPLFTRTLNAVLQFVSPWTDFGTMLDQSFTTSASNVTYTGKFWINGDYSITGTNVSFMGGPVYVSGNVTGAASVVINGDLYYGGASKGNVTVMGTIYNFMPAITFPAVDTSYYESHYNVLYTVNKTLIFNADGTYTDELGATVTIPSTGLVILVRGRDVNVRGTLRGRVTLVCTRVAGTGGMININGNLVYANGTNQASNLDSLALLTTYLIRITKPSAANMTVCGVLQSSGADNFQLTGTGGGSTAIIGSRNKGITLYISTTVSITYDTNLNSFPPPGLPERPYLVTWHWSEN